MLRATIILTVTVLLMIGGCASRPTPSEIPVTETTLVPEKGTLPTSSGPLGKHDRSVRAVQEVCMSITSLRGPNDFLGPELLALATKPNFSILALGNADTDVLKACVVAGWAPLVVLRFPSGGKYLRAAVGYDDISAEWSLLNPTDTSRHANNKLNYVGFGEQWTAGRNTCFLVFPEYTNETQVRVSLKRYLPTEKADALQIAKTGGRR